MLSLSVLGHFLRSFEPAHLVNYIPLPLPPPPPIFHPMCIGMEFNLNGDPNQYISLVTVRFSP